MNYAELQNNAIFLNIDYILFQNFSFEPWDIVSSVFLKGWSVFVKKKKKKKGKICSSYMRWGFSLFLTAHNGSLARCWLFCCVSAGEELSICRQKETCCTQNMEKQLLSLSRKEHKNNLEESFKILKSTFESRTRKFDGELE